MDNKVLTELEDKFCAIYACGPAPYNGNARKAYDLVFNGATGMLYDPDVDGRVMRSVDVSLQVQRLMQRDEIKERIDKYQSMNVVNATTLRPRLTAMLLGIADECSTTTLCDRVGTPLSPAALRSVAVNAITRLCDMYGIKEDIAHKLTLENANGDGITFNLFLPDANKENAADVVE